MIALINVLLVDRNRLFIEAVQLLISQEEDINVVGMTTNGKKTRQLIDEKQPDLVLLELELPHISGIKITEYIKKNFPKMKVVFLTSETNDELIIKGIATGADGFLLKTSDANSLIRSIRDSYHGEVVISGKPAQLLANKIIQLNHDQKALLNERLLQHNIRLTNRELEVAYLLKENLSNREIAQELDLSEGTVKNYISELYQKINCKRRKEVIQYLRSLVRYTEI